MISNAEYKTGCIRETVKDFVRQYEDDYKLILNYCAILDEDDKKSCYEEMYNSLESWFGNTENKIKTCNLINNVDKKFAFWCLSE